MTENVNTAAERKQKMKRAGIAGGGLLGIGALASVALMGTGANWTDSEVVGAEFESGSFGLEVSVDGGTPTDTWTSGNTIDTFAELDLFAGSWGPGDSDSAEFALRVAEGSSHNATLTLADVADSVAEHGWDVEITPEGEDGPVDEEWSTDLATGDTISFTVDVEFASADGDDANANQDESGEVTFTFDAESQPEL